MWDGADGAERTVGRGRTVDQRRMLTSQVTVDFRGTHLTGRDLCSPLNTGEDFFVPDRPYPPGLFTKKTPARLWVHPTVRDLSGGSEDERESRKVVGGTWRFCGFPRVEELTLMPDGSCLV